MESPTPDPELQALRKTWAPAWCIWRARRDTDPPDVHAGDFVATRVDEDAGPHRTVMGGTAAELDAALREQRTLATRACGPLNPICGLG